MKQVTDTPLKYAVGATIRKLRHDRAMNLVDLSKLSHVSYPHISDIERGATSAGFDILQALADGLELTTTELVKEIYDYLKEEAND
jgi:transcriptional regulator with XRE-family HTH domain